MPKKNSVALVTGASQGIGKAIAIKLAQKGMSVVIHYYSHEASAHQVLEECNKYSKGNCIVQADLTNENDIYRMVAFIQSKYSSVCLLVNNAGIFDSKDTFTNLSVFEKLIQYNFLSHVRVTTSIIPLMQGEGQIINISSIHGRVGFGRGNTIAYSASKAALESYTKNLAKVLAPRIRVNGVAPGKTLTSMWGTLTKEEAIAVGKTDFIDRFIYPDEIADTVVFLIANHAMIGEIVTVDGGLSLQNKE